MACPACLVAFSGAPSGALGEGYVRQTSRAYGDEPTAAPSLASLGVFAVSAVGAFAVLALLLPSAARRLA